MPAESAQDRLNMLRIEDFGCVVNYGTGTVSGIFDRNPVDAGLGGMSITDHEATLLARTSDVPNLVLPTDPPTLYPIGPMPDGVTYRIRRWELEGDGAFIRLYLVRNDG